MPFQPVTDGAQVVVHGSMWDGTVTANVFGVKQTTTLTQAVADAWSDVFGICYDAIKGYIFSGNTFTGVTVTDLRTEGAPQFTSDHGLFPVTGTSGADPLPGQNAALITWLTGTRGKSFRGRTYIPGLTEASITSGVLTAGFVTALQTFENDVITNANVGVISRYHDSALRNSGIVTVITGAQHHDHVATQRRRRHFNT